MGKFAITIGVCNQQGEQLEDLEVTVDTGSTFTAVPRAMLARLRVPVRRTGQSRLADGRPVPVDSLKRTIKGSDGMTMDRDTNGARRTFHRALGDTPALSRMVWESIGKLDALSTDAELHFGPPKQDFDDRYEPPLVDPLDEGTMHYGPGGWPLWGRRACALPICTKSPAAKSAWSWCPRTW